jgi:hypothetical protein
VGGGAQVFEFLAGKDVDGDQMDLGVAVLAGLGSRHFDNLARTVLDHDETVLAQGGALHRVGGRSTGVGAFERVLLMLWCASRVSLVELFLCAREVVVNSCQSQTGVENPVAW